MDDTFRVVIVGAGMAGLLLCQALRRNGIHAELYERQSRQDAGFQGYRLGLSTMGQNAIRDTISPEGWQAFTALLRERADTGGLLMVDPENCEPYWDWARFPSEPKPLLLPRSELRDLLLKELDGGAVHYSKTFQSYQQVTTGTQNKVNVLFTDGTQVQCDVLVGADGSRSTVRQALGLDNRRDTKIRCILINGELCKAVVQEFPAAFQTRHWMLLTNSFGIFLSPWLPRLDRLSTEDQDQSDVSSLECVDWEKANFSTGIFGHKDDFSVRLGAASPVPSSRDLKQCLVEILENNKADARLITLARSGGENSAQMVKFHSCVRPSDTWYHNNARKPVVLIGDALHAMPPTRGLGGNAALADAADLAKYVIDGRKRSDKMDTQTWTSEFYRVASDRAFGLVGSSICWARQYITGGKIFDAYQGTTVEGRDEMEKDNRFSFPDPASEEAIPWIFS